MPTIVKIIGLPEALSFLGSFPNSLKTGLNTELKSIGSTGANTMKNNAHVQTGKMKNAITSKSEGDLKVSITSPMGYSGHENKRGNPHNFFDRSVQVIEKDANTKIVNKINSLIK